MSTQIFVPAFPTVAPEALFGLGRGTCARHYPFSAPAARYFYFARNAIFRAVHDLGLAGAEVLVPAYHHGVEIEALLAAGARVRFYRVGAGCDVDLEDVERKITAATRALYLTHFLGFPGPVRAMRQLADRHGLRLIEDCALALFSAADEGPLGLTGDVAIFCLYKVLALTDGGVLIERGGGAVDGAQAAPRPRLASSAAVLAASLLRNVALRGGRAGRALRALVLAAGKRGLSAASVRPVMAGTQHFDRDHARLGMSRVSEHLLRMQDVASIVARRRRNYLFLHERLRQHGPSLFASLPPGVVPLCYPLLVDDNRRVMEQLVARGVEAVDFWRQGHAACDESEFPEVAWLRRSVLEIPCHQDVSLPTLARVADAVHDVLAASRREQVPAEAGVRPSSVPMAS